LAAGGAAALAFPSRELRAASLSPPNIIFFLCDDVGWGDLGCYGQTQILTPNIDALAAGGMRFTNYYAGSSVCAPSRCALMTGLHTGHTPLRRNDIGALSAQDTTVADLLRARGYVTGAFGKWHLGRLDSGGEPWLHGFDEYFGNVEWHHDYYPTTLYRNSRPVTIEGNLDGRQEVYYPDLCTQEALAFIRRHAAERFFLYIGCIIAHINDKVYEATGNGLAVPSQDPYTDRPWPEADKNFAAMLTRMDGYIGRITRLLRALGIDRDTLILFASDNGPDYRLGRDPAFFGSTGPLTGRKGQLYEGGIRMPMVAYWPGAIPAGTVSAQPWANWDFLPTAAEAAGAALPTTPIDGTSMLSVLLGGPLIPRESLYWESREEYTLGPSQAVRVGDWKGIRLGRDQPTQLYDLANDIGETTDVALAHPDVVAAMETLMSSLRTGVAPEVRTANMLERDCVDPDEGGANDTKFRWTCRVNDYDGDPPAYVRLTIHRDGAPWFTADMSPCASQTFRGRLYEYRRRLPMGNYHYQIEAADDAGAARFPAEGPMGGPIMPSHPYLTWTDDPGYEADCVEPHSGEADSTLFQFRVRYCAHDGDPPEYIRLTLWRDGARYRSAAMKPTPLACDPVPPEGEIYHLIRRLPAGEYQYRIAAADPHGRARGPASVLMGDLSVGGGTALVTGLATAPTRAGGAQITFALSASSDVTVEVTNIAGRPVATVVTGTKLRRGMQTVVWNGLSARGSPVPNGLYVVRVAARAEGGPVSRAITTCAVRR
jgi:arylsulfatase A-like enzyme